MGNNLGFRKICNDTVQLYGAGCKYQVDHVGGAQEDASVGDAHNAVPTSDIQMSSHRYYGPLTLKLQYTYDTGCLYTYVVHVLCSDAEFGYRFVVMGNDFCRYGAN